MGPVRLALLLLAAAAAVLLGGGEAVYIPYNTSAGVVNGKLNVHVVPHTHDDVGWLKTVDQYYVGSNNSIQGACVQNVLDSLVPALLKDENRKFIYVEQAFFQRWWRQQSDMIKDTVKGLVSSGRLEFINGGMCMHDEATVHYIDMIDQTTLGHRFIKEEFGQIPRIGWQIDPFGHSAVQAYLLGAEVGFDALYFFRIDYQDRDTRNGTKELEVVWRGSKTFGSSADIFAGIFPKNYEPPPGEFYFEVDDTSPVVQDDPLLFDYNVEQRVNDFVAAALAQANVTRTNHIMFTMGTDFKYQYAESWFRQMDKLIHYVNKDGRVNALYSTPSIYTDAKFSTNEPWPLKTNDFFPYADNPNAYWTGYFTSRPALKRYVRMMSGYYLAARQLEFFIGKSKSGSTTDSLGDALALAQHHDAVTGTEKQHVANDYAKRLSIGYKKAEELVSTSLGCLSESGSNSRCSSPTTKFGQCPLLNITYCPPSEMNLSQGKSLVVLVYNSLGWKREDVLRIPVMSDSIVVHDSEGKEIESQLLPIANVSLNLRDRHVKVYLGTSPAASPKFWVAFPASVPPLGFSTYFISSGKRSASISSTSTLNSQGNESRNLQVGQGRLKLHYDAAGSLSQYSDSKTQVEANFEQKYKYYIGQDGSGDDPQASGAYIFRPKDVVPIKTDGQVPPTILRGPILDEVHQQINPWIYQITRVYKGKDYVETEFIVGPIPVDDENGKELSTEIITSMATNKTFYTDSSGRDFIKRVRDYRSEWKIEVNQPVAGNYYPINLGIYVEDGSKELSILVDRSVGGSSIKDGQIELMLHRRLLNDDGRGVAEALEEKVCLDDQCEGLVIEGKYYLKIDPQGDGARWRRTFGQELYSPLLLAFTEQDGGNWANSHVSSFSAMDPTYSLPENVALLTLEELEDGSVLLRLAHLYEAGEHKDLSAPASVDLKRVFPDNKIGKIIETSLSANQERAAMEKKRLKWKVAGPPQKENVVKFMIDGDFMPVRGKTVRYTIKENYPGKFVPELTFTQVEKLRALFRPIISLPVPEAPPLHYVDNSHPAPSAAFLPPSASSSYPTQSAAYVHHPSAYVLTPAAHLAPNEPYACPDSQPPARTAQFAAPAYYVTTTGHLYQASYQAYGPSPATYHYAQAPPLQLVYLQAQHPVRKHVTDPACSSDPNYYANGNDPYRYDAVKSHYQETTSGRAAAPHEVAATNLQLVMHYGYAPGSEGATRETTQSSAEGAASAIYSHVGAPATTQAAPLVYAVAAAPHEVAGTNLQLVMHYGYASGSEGATGETTQSSAEGAALAIYSQAGAPVTTQAVPSVYAVAAAPANL
ncbi:alpha-mannosidase At3g26720-like [Triticum dicoccoides]|uniref:alpha-mannosidase At3g26720-like n=1 Tax=Triticum dicoccoides TaxID=85692 RepID=UPI00188E38EA|nr:alpha-mannosidase At3g26720-like [Triticum dicoccoides]